MKTLFALAVMVSVPFGLAHAGPPRVPQQAAPVFVPPGKGPCLRCGLLTNPRDVVVNPAFNARPSISAYKGAFLPH